MKRLVYSTLKEITFNTNIVQYFHQVAKMEKKKAYVKVSKSRVLSYCQWKFKIYC